MWSVCKRIQAILQQLNRHIAIIAFPLNGLFPVCFSWYQYSRISVCHPCRTLFWFSPWILLLLIPAITMQLCGWVQALLWNLANPGRRSRWQITGGKYTGAFLVVPYGIIAYYFAVSMQQLSAQEGLCQVPRILYRPVIAGRSFVSIGICCSSFTTNAVVLSAALCLLPVYSGFNVQPPARIIGRCRLLRNAGIDFH